MSDSWITFLLTPPNLAEIVDTLGGIAEFDIIHAPLELRNDLFDLRCRVCSSRIHAELFVLNSNSDGNLILQNLIDSISELPGAKENHVVFEHLSNTRFIVRSRAGFIPECDCEFRLHQVVASGNFLWFTDGRFADDVDEYWNIQESN